MRLAEAPLPLLPTRIASIDRMRGAVMLLMALDHVRVFAGVPAGGPTPALFFTRWITHFCAPAFVFLAGTSAWLHGRKHPGLARFLAIRGAWLVFLELTVVRLGWTFNLNFTHQMAGVLWVLGWCMIALAVLSKLPLGVVVAAGAVVVAGHDLLDSKLFTLPPDLGSGLDAALWKLLYLGFWAGPIRSSEDGASLTVLYSFVPWIGVMALGFGFGRVLTLPPARRDRISLALGLGAVALFLVLRGFDLYGDPRPWREAGTTRSGAPMPAVLAFLNTSKYPASLSFLLMTLGPAVAALPALERVRGRIADWLTVFGRVPLFYYLVHIPLIHALALLVSLARLGMVHPWLFEDHPMGNSRPPEECVWSLPLLYAVWIAAILLLAFPSRWFADLRARRRERWLSYL